MSSAFAGAVETFAGQSRCNDMLALKHMFLRAPAVHGQISGEFWWVVVYCSDPGQGMDRGKQVHCFCAEVVHTWTGDTVSTFNSVVVFPARGQTRQGVARLLHVC
jgi:hypothetical protein